MTKKTKTPEREFGRKGSNPGVLKEQGTGISRDVPDKDLLKRAVDKINNYGSNNLTASEFAAYQEHMSNRAERRLLERLGKEMEKERKEEEKRNKPEVADGGLIMSSKTKPKSKKKHGAYSETGIPMMGGGNVRKPTAYRNRMYNYGGRVAKYNNK